MAHDTLIWAPKHTQPNTVITCCSVKLENKTEGNTSGIEWGAALEMGLKLGAKSNILEFGEGRRLVC